MVGIFSGECIMGDARISLLQRMPVFGGIREDILKFLLELAPIVSVPQSQFFFHLNLFE